MGSEKINIKINEKYSNNTLNQTTFMSVSAYNFINMFKLKIT